MKIRNPFNWNLRFGTIPSEFKEAMTYEEQIQWLYYQLKEIKEGTANYNYELLENKPSIDGIILSGNITKSQLGIDNNYLGTTNKPSINNVTLIGNKTLNELGIQGKLIAGSGITISSDNVISSTGGGGGGGTTNYLLLDNKPSINGVTLEPNQTGKSLYLQDELSYVLTNYVTNKTLFLLDIDVGDTILPPYSEIFGDSVNSCYIEIDTTNGTYVDIKGDYDLIKLNQANKVVSIFSTYHEYTHGYFESSTDGKLFIGFYNIDQYTPEVKIIETGLGNWYIHNNLQKEDKAIYHDLKDLVETNYPYKNYSSELIQNKLYKPQLDGTVIFDDFTNGATIKIDKKIFSMVYIKGKCIDYASIMYLDSNNKIIDSYPANQNFNQYLKLQIPDGTTSIIFNFTNTNEVIPELWIIEIEKYKTFKSITGDPLTLNIDGTITQGGNTYNLETGIYVLDTPIYYLSSSNTAFYIGEIIFYDSEGKIFNSIMKKIYYIDDLFSQEWVIMQNENITNEIVNSREMLPTSQAVYNELQNRKVYSIDVIKSSDDSDVLDDFKDGLLYIKTFENDESTPSSETEINQLFYFDIGTQSWYSFSKGNQELILALGIYQNNFESYKVGYSSSKWNLTDKSFTIPTLAGDLDFDSSATALVNASQVRNYINNYSTTEKRIGTWIDGKPLYRKVITVPALPNNDTLNVPVDNTFDIKNYLVVISSTGTTIVLPTAINAIGTFINKNGHYIGIQTTTNRTSYTDNYAIIEYTKTTD